MNTRPTILCIGGLDPTGGAGLQADIEAVAACGGHAVTLCTALTAQNSRCVSRVEPVSAELLRNQFALLRDEMQIQACKIGLIPNTATAELIATLLEHIPGLPVVLDPIDIAGNGDPLAMQPLLERITILLPRTTLLTPNAAEWTLLTKNDPADEIGQTIFSLGPEAILVTGADAPTEYVENALILRDGNTQRYSWQRLPYCYHGSGCTLSSALATFLGHGLTIPQAASEAQVFTWRSLHQADNPGGTQHFPRRLTNPVTALIPQKYRARE